MIPLKINIRIYILAVGTLVLLLFTSCEKMFEYSPYESRVKSDQRNTTSKQLDRILKVEPTSEQLTFAVIADNHYHYDNLEKCIHHINTESDISFVVFAGDIADQALLKEFEIFYDVMEGSNKPYLTVIGNHDYQSNGGEVYQQMFGPVNYSFVYNGYKFTMFDDVFWESNRTPDFNWLENELDTESSYKQNVVIAHLPPFSSQYNQKYEKLYSDLMFDYDIHLSLHGHTHSYFYRDVYDDGVKYLVTPWLKQANYTKITLDGAEHKIELINL